MAVSDERGAGALVVGERGAGALGPDESGASEEMMLRQLSASSKSSSRCTSQTTCTSDGGSSDCGSEGSGGAESAELETDIEAASMATSSEAWLDPGSVMIFIDWDDTLFPTTWLRCHRRFGHWVQGKLPAAEVLTAEERARFEALDTAARAFVVAAGQYARLCCVTLSRTGWVQRTLEAFMPKTAAAWKELGVQVRYASEEKLKPRTSGVGQWVRPNVAETELLAKEAYTRQKQRAMTKALRRLYGTGSWKNVVSIGDGDFEIDALKEIGFGHSNTVSSKSGLAKELRVKTLKLANSPEVEQMQEQLQVMQAWLPRIVAWRSDCHVDLGAGGDAGCRWQEPR